LLTHKRTYESSYETYEAPKSL